MNILDSIRYTNGIDTFRSYFSNLAKHNPTEALKLINSSNLNFASLFLLQEEIKQANLIYGLSLKNKAALNISNDILEQKLSLNQACRDPSVLKWMLATGCIDDGLDPEYDEVLDIAAILLTRELKDTAVLPIIEDMIFKRHRRGAYIHDLVWAFFELRAPHSLMMVANRLLSSEIKDVELAQKLLGFAVKTNDNRNARSEDHYFSFISWLQENRAFLHFTGESLQQRRNPVPYVVDLEAKYLCKPICINTAMPLRPLSNMELKLLNDFKCLDNDTKSLLSSFSLILYKKDIHTWNSWLNYPISKQISYAKIRGIK